MSSSSISSQLGCCLQCNTSVAISAPRETSMWWEAGSWGHVLGGKWQGLWTQRHRKELPSTAQVKHLKCNGPVNYSNFLQENSHCKGHFTIAGHGHVTVRTRHCKSRVPLSQMSVEWASCMEQHGAPHVWPSVTSVKPSHIWQMKYTACVLFTWTSRFFKLHNTYETITFCATAYSLFTWIMHCFEQ